MSTIYLKKFQGSDGETRFNKQLVKTIKRIGRHKNLQLNSSVQANNKEEID